MITRKLNDFTIGFQDEEWRDAVGYEGRYLISNYGRLKSLASPLTRNVDYIMKGSYNKKSYHKQLLSVKGKFKVWSTHRLVAFAFINNHNNLPHVNHIDEDKTNNFYLNLEWCDAKYNNNHGTRTKRAILTNKERKTCCVPILKVDKEGKILERYESKVQAKRALGRCNNYIRMLLNGIFDEELGFTLILENNKVIRRNTLKRKVIKYTLDGLIVETFHSLTEASIKHNVSIGAICLNATGKTKVCCGHKFRYEPITS